MNVSNLRPTSPVPTCLLAGLTFCCFPSSNSHAQIVAGATTAAPLDGGASSGGGNIQLHKCQ